MITKPIGVPAGFQVIQESDGWRLACHSYDKDVNSMEALRCWGAHLDSDEAFVLLKGKMILATAGTVENPKDITITSAQPGQVYVVEKGEKHAVVLEEGTVVFITENLDMSNSVQQEMTEEELKEIKEKW